MAIRTKGALLLVVCAFALHQLNILVHIGPVHDGTAGEMLLSLIAVVTGVGGAAMVIVGPALFRPYLWPPPDSY